MQRHEPERGGQRREQGGFGGHVGRRYPEERGYEGGSERGQDPRARRREWEGDDIPERPGRDRPWAGYTDDLQGGAWGESGSGRGGYREPRSWGSEGGSGRERYSAGYGASSPGRGRSSPGYGEEWPPGPWGEGGYGPSSHEGRPLGSSWSAGDSPRPGLGGQGPHGSWEQGSCGGQPGSSSFARSSAFDPGARGPHYGRAPQGYSRSDERIREDLCDRLMQGELDPSGISVTVRNAEVTLEGSVEDRRSKYRVEELAESILGVKDVNNSLRIKRRDEHGGSEESRELEGSSKQADGRKQQQPAGSTSHLGQKQI